jgi:glucose/mannose transport system permease protein
MTAATASVAASTPRRKAGRRRKLQPRRVVIFVFLAMAAAFFAVPLYVILVTSFKTMDQIRQGQLFALPQVWTLDAWRFAWSQACSGMACNGVSAGFVNSLWILAPASS